MGRHFIIQTDQRSLKFLTEQRLLGEEQFKWTSKLIGFDFEIKYKPGCENRVADALSRKMIFAAISLVHFSDLDDWWEEIQADDKLRTVTQDLLMNPKAHLGYQL